MKPQTKVLDLQKLLAIQPAEKEETTTPLKTPRHKMQISLPGQIVHAVPPEGKRGYLLVHRKMVVVKGADRPDSYAIVRIEENTVFNGRLVEVQNQHLREGPPEI